MAFSDDFTAALGADLGIEVDGSAFESPEVTAQLLLDYRSFVDGLDSVSRATLSALAESGLDLSQAEDEEGPVDLPGGPFFAIAAAAQRPLDEIASSVQTSIDSATGVA